MTTLIILFALAHAGLIGLGIYFALKRRAYLKKKKENPLYFRADQEPQGVEKFCDGYSAGTFYW